VTSYGGFGGELIRRLKYHGAIAAAQDIADSLSNILPDDDCILTYLPTATGRVRARGFDQARLVARAVAAKTGYQFVPLLRRLGQADQVGTGREARFAQASSAFRVVNRSLLSAQKVVLIDDVITTGASLDSAAKVLKSAGAKRIYGVVFCRS
jgi:predicted amidophosphoribosyltransferase